MIRGINWRQTFPFVNIFRSFRIAIHLSKLVLGLALLISVYVGGRVLDAVWLSSARAVPGEIAQYGEIEKGTAPGPLSTWRNDEHKKMDDDYANMLIQYGVITPQPDEMPDALLNRASSDVTTKSKLPDLDAKIDAQLDADKKAAEDAQTAELKAADDAYAASNKDLGSQRTRDSAKDQASRDRSNAIAAAYDKAYNAHLEAHAGRGEGLFSAFFEFEVRQVYLTVQSIAHNEWLPGGGLVDHVYDLLVTGPVWLIFTHTVFFVLFGLWFLLMWSLFGGAISRIAAVQVARDEKISIRQAMNFAVGKLLSFGSAPLIPILIVIAIGLLVSIGSLLGNIPFLGPIIVGAFFFIALGASFVMTLVLLGASGGFNLMYPTIAVEGSDSFDAISRSFSYVYARPWRMLFYTLVALIYGSATYIFVHYFVWIMLVLTHHFVGMGIYAKAADTRDLLSVMWPSPSTAGRLSYHVHYETLNLGEKIGALFIRIWVMLLISFIGAFAISLYFTANTIIYYLMRVEVYSTEMDDVYLEQSEDDLEVAVVETTVTTVAPTASPAPTTPAEESAPPSAPQDAPPTT
jgi:hypothetical protein